MIKCFLERFLNFALGAKKKFCGSKIFRFLSFWLCLRFPVLGKVIKYSRMGSTKKVEYASYQKCTFFKKDRIPITISLKLFATCKCTCPE